MWATCSTDLFELTDYFFEGRRSIDLDRGRCPSQRLHLCDVAKNHLPIGGRFPVRVVVACCDPREEQIDRSTEQSDMVELGQEPKVRGAAQTRRPESARATGPCYERKLLSLARCGFR